MPDDQTLFRVEPSLAGKRRECVAFARSPLTSALLVYSACALVIAACVFAGSQSLARKATLTGQVELADGEMKLFPDRRRRVTELTVKDGDLVTEQQVLAVLHDLQYSRHGSQTAQLESIDWQIELLARSARSARADQAKNASHLNAKRTLLTTAIESAREEERAAEGLAKISQSQLERGQLLFEAGHLPRAQLEELQMQHSKQRQAQAAIQQQQLQLQTQLRSIDQQADSGASNLQRQLNGLEQQRTDLARERESLLTSFEQVVRAPVAGRITGVLSHVGATLDASTPLFTLVRRNTSYRGRLWAGSHAAGELAEQQRVNLMLDAFPHQKHGMLPGRIAYINDSPLSLRELGAPWEGNGRAYAVTVALDTTHPLFSRVKPGMNLQADVKLDNSLLVSRLFEPLISAWQRSF